MYKSPIICLHRNTIFIFLSNVGGSAITEKALWLWRKGVPREEFKIEDFDKLIMKAAYNEEGMLTLLYKTCALCCKSCRHSKYYRYVYYYF